MDHRLDPVSIRVDQAGGVAVIAVVLAQTRRPAAGAAAASPARWNAVAAWREITHAT